MMKDGLVLLVVILGCSTSTLAISIVQRFGLPQLWHAQCNITWEIDAPCPTIEVMLVEQMQKWKGPENCNMGGEKCLYAITSNKPLEVKGTHTTPKHHYVDDLTFTLSGVTTNHCHMIGFSRSEIFFAVLDKGTNYCNMENLITGSGIDKLGGYSEKTSDTICTEYSTHNCTIY